MAADIDPFQTERPVIFSLKVVGDATANFDEKRKIGEGGYGSVYLGFIGTHVRYVCTVSCRRIMKRPSHAWPCSQEIAVKKMRASKSKEFFAELKALCKVHHINVVRSWSIRSIRKWIYTSVLVLCLWPQTLITSRLSWSVMLLGMTTCTWCTNMSRTDRLVSICMTRCWKVMQWRNNRAC